VELGKQVLHVELPKDIQTRRRGQFSTGDLIRVKRNTSLRRQTTSLASVAAGRHLSVHRVHDDGKWVEASVISGGNVVSGWLSVDEVEFVAAESDLSPSLGNLSWNQFASAGALAQKAKQFDDGLMAAVQQAAQSGHGQSIGKVVLLENLARRLGTDPAGNIILAAGKLGQVPVSIPPANKPGVDALISQFLAEPARSKPIGFYTWNNELSAIFQQDRMLQSDLTEPPGKNALVIARALQADTTSRKAYEGYLELQSRLTNPLVAADLRPVLADLDSGKTPSIPKGARFFPPSYSHEVDLLKRLFPDGIIPPDFPLMDTLVERVKTGALDLTPRFDSGWYDQQLWSLEPFVRPHHMPEGRRWTANDEYHKHLVELFKGVWALARETHIKDLELAPASAAAPFDRPEPKIRINVDPQLSAEPVATSYLRRAMSYRFVRTVLAEHFGEASLKQLYRQTATGPVAMNLDDELRQVEGLFLGAYVTTTRQLGMVEQNTDTAGSGAGADADSQAFLNWSANLHRDPDLSTDIRMMVPLYYDPQLKKTKVWAFLGWTTKQIYVSFEVTPGVVVVDAAGNPVPERRLEISYSSAGHSIATPVFQELFVSKLMNRDEFRKHCDAYGSRTAILKNLD
jgi:hypothetical protein